MMEIKKVGVLGCGLMGSGIAQVCATAGFDVVALEIEQKYIDKGFTGIRKSLEKFSAKGTLKESPEQIFTRLKGTTKKKTWRAATSSSRPSLKTWTRNAKCTPRSIPS